MRNEKEVRHRKLLPGILIIFSFVLHAGCENGNTLHSPATFSTEQGEKDTAMSMEWPEDSTPSKLAVTVGGGCTYVWATDSAVLNEKYELATKNPQKINQK